MQALCVLCVVVSLRCCYITQGAFARYIFSIDHTVKRCLNKSAVQKSSSDPLPSGWTTFHSSSKNCLSKGRKNPTATRQLWYVDAPISNHRIWTSDTHRQQSSSSWEQIPFVGAINRCINHKPN